MNKNNLGDIIKAMRCLASQDIDGSCYADFYNRSTAIDEPRMMCGSELERSIQCPYYQEGYGVCYEKGNCQEWLRTAADLLEEYLEEKNCRNKRITVRVAESAKLVVGITDRMVSDYRECEKLAGEKGDGKDCRTCSLNTLTDFFDVGLCEIPEVVEAIKQAEKER